MHINPNTPFADLSAQQLAAIMAWAHSHDWGEATYYEVAEDGVLRLYGLTNGTDEFGAFTLKELRDWAGY